MDFQNMLPELEEKKLWMDYFNYSGSKVVPAGDSATIELGVSASHDFECLTITGTYTTDEIAGDDGVCKLAATLVDNGSNTILWKNPVNLALILSPGRVRSSGIAGDPSNQLFWPQTMEHLFEATSLILVEIFNSGDKDNTVFMNFEGNKHYLNKLNPNK